MPLVTGSCAISIFQFYRRNSVTFNIFQGIREADATTSSLPSPAILPAKEITEQRQSRNGERRGEEVSFRCGVGEGGGERVES
ncbi:hypothetical protein V6N13_054163 [Hibiscus sabdariffa]